MSPATPGISTVATSATVGGSISDTATISGLVNPDGTGTTTFTAYSDKHLHHVGVEQHRGSGHRRRRLQSGDFTPGPGGTYNPIASSSGDGNNDPATTACGDEGETSTVERSLAEDDHAGDGGGQPGEPTSDTATISGLVNPDGTGAITFTAYSDNTCATSCPVAPWSGHRRRRLQSGSPLVRRT